MSTHNSLVARIIVILMSYWLIKWSKLDYDMIWTRFGDKFQKYPNSFDCWLQSVTRIVRLAARRKEPASATHPVRSRIRSTPPTLTAMVCSVLW